MRHEIRLFFVALQFLTRVPVPAWVGYEPAWLNHCVRHFPLVGLAVGLFGAVVLSLALALFPALVAVALSMIATIWLTGAFHEDGLADTCDGLGGAVQRERALEIMKDSRIGTYGAVALVLALGLKAATLTALVQVHPVLACIALAWGHAASRMAAVGLMWLLPYGGDADHAKAKPLATGVGASDLLVAFVWLVLISLGTLGLVWESGESGEPGAADPVAVSLTAATLCIGLVVWRAARWLGKRLGGYTGDTLGALQQVTEIVALLTWLAVAQQFGLAHG